MKHKTKIEISHYFFPIFLLFIVLFTSHNTSAQDNYLPGIIITQQNDTLNGFINFKDWINSPDAIQFKVSETASTSEYPAEKVAYFSVANQQFFGRITTIDKTPLKIEDMPRGPVRTLVTDTIFLKVLLHSDSGLSLLFHRDDQGKAHFFYEENENLTELILFKYYNPDLLSVATISEYKNQLLIVMGDCSALYDKIQNCNFTTNALVSIFKEYNSCKGEKINYIYPKPKIEKLFGIFVGGSLTKITLQSNSGPDFAQADYNFGSGFRGGFFYDVDFAGERETVWLNNKIYFSRFKSDGLGFDTSSLRFEETEIQFDILDIGISTAITVQSNSPHLKPFVFGGFGVSYSVINENRQIITQTNIYTNESTTLVTDNEILKRDFHNDILLGGGINLNKKYFLEIQYARAFSIAGYSYIQGTQDDFSLSLKYAF